MRDEQRVVASGALSLEDAYAVGRPRLVTREIAADGIGSGISRLERSAGVRALTRAPKKN
jgi:hypothetical protein